MRIATWNVNSIKARLDHVRQWLAAQKPDILMIQELKGLEFPASEFQSLGYHTAAVPQKAYNGVATLSLHPIEIILEKLPGDDADEQARYLETKIGDLRFINIYLPNGNPIGTEKFNYKLSWMKRLGNRLAQLRREEIPVVIGGDFNVIPEDRDCFDPALWSGDALFRPESRALFRAMMWLGFSDAFRINNKAAEQYTYWDYQAGAWAANKGIRIDHFLLSPGVTDKFVSCVIDTAPRSTDKASDHTPVILEIAA